jgi:hypothetical protein
LGLSETAVSILQHFSAITILLFDHAFMKSRQQPPKKKPGKEKVQRPAGAERTDRESPAPASGNDPTGDKAERPRSKPVTNQDEQDKITNAGADDLPIAEK